MSAAVLPADFSETLEAVTRAGVLDEEAQRVEARLATALVGAATAAGRGPTSHVGDWAAELLDVTKQAIRQELCAADGRGLKGKYADVLAQAPSKDAIAAVGAVVARAIAPVHATPAVLIYASVWLLKIDADRWCTLPARMKVAGRW